jgi:hypothetical protein
MSAEEAIITPLPALQPQHTSSSYTLTHTQTNPLHPHPSHLSRKETRDPNLDINLPYRTLSPNANLAEYVTEKLAGEIPAQGRRTPDGKKDYKLVTFLPDDPENPKNWSKAYKWYITSMFILPCCSICFALLDAERANESM